MYGVLQGPHKTRGCLKFWRRLPNLGQKPTSLASDSQLLTQSRGPPSLTQYYCPSSGSVFRKCDPLILRNYRRCSLKSKRCSGSQPGAVPEQCWTQLRRILTDRPWAQWGTAGKQQRISTAQRVPKLRAFKSPEVRNMPQIVEVF